MCTQSALALFIDWHFLVFLACEHKIKKGCPWKMQNVFKTLFALQFGNDTLVSCTTLAIICILLDELNATQETWPRDYYSSNFLAARHPTIPKCGLTKLDNGLCKLFRNGSDHTMESSCAWHKIVHDWNLHCCSLCWIRWNSSGQHRTFGQFKANFWHKNGWRKTSIIGCVRSMGHDDGFYLQIHICT